MKPAAEEILDGEDSWQVKEPLLDLLNPVYINVFIPPRVDYLVPIETTSNTILGGLEQSPIMSNCAV